MEGGGVSFFREGERSAAQRSAAQCSAVYIVAAPSRSPTWCYMVPRCFRSGKVWTNADPVLGLRGESLNECVFTRILIQARGRQSQNGIDRNSPSVSSLGCSAVRTTPLFETIDLEPEPGWQGQKLAEWFREEEANSSRSPIALSPGTGVSRSFRGRRLKRERSCQDSLAQMRPRTGLSLPVSFGRRTGLKQSEATRCAPTFLGL